MRKDYEYIIVGSDNFWYASGLSSLKKAKEEIKEIIENVTDYGEPDGLNFRERVPDKFRIMRVDKVVTIDN